MTNNKLTDERSTLREAAQNYQIALAWYQSNIDSPAALQAWDAATSEFMRVIGNRETDIIAELLDEIGELQEYRNASSEPIGAPDAWLWKKKTGYITAGISRPMYEPLHSAAIPLYAVPQPLSNAERTELESYRNAAPVSFDDLRDAVAEVSGGPAMEWGDIYKGHQAVPFINFNSLARIVDKFRVAPQLLAVSEPGEVPSPELLCRFVTLNYANYQGAWLCGKSSEILRFLLNMAGHECEKVACTINGVGHLYVRCGDLILDPSIAQFGDYPEIWRGEHPCVTMNYIEHSTPLQECCRTTGQNHD